MQDTKNQQDFSHICYVSREINISKLIVDVISFSKIFEKYSSQISKIIITISFGNRVVLCSKQNDIKTITPEDFIEIVDIDPIRKTIVLMGKKHPTIETIVHWMIHKARTDINAVVEIQSNQLFQKNCNKIPIHQINSKNTIEQVKTILQALKKDKNICIKDETIILTGLYLKEIKEYILKNFEDI